MEGLWKVRLFTVMHMMRINIFSTIIMTSNIGVKIFVYVFFLGSFWTITPIDEIQSHPDNHVVKDFKYE